MAFDQQLADSLKEIERLNAEIKTLRNFINAAKAQLDLALADYGQPQ